MKDKLPVSYGVPFLVVLILDIQASVLLMCLNVLFPASGAI